MRVFLNWLYNVANALSQFVNAAVFLGDPDESLSGVIGKSIIGSGWARYVPWPVWLRSHFVNSIEWDRGENSAFRRRGRP